MALSGSFTGTTSNGSIVPKIVWSGVQSETGVYTDVTATLYYSRTDSYSTYGTWVGYLNIGDNTYSGSKYLTISYNSNTNAISKTVRIYHDEDGTKTITISATGGISGTTLTDTTISKSVTLDTIPIPSKLSATTADIGGICTITIGAASANFTHTLTYSFGRITGSITTKTSSTTIAWTIPTSFYNEIQSAPSGWGVITCTTYNGTTVVGTSTCEFTAVANKALCSPDVSILSAVTNEESIALTGSNKIIVAGISDLNVVTTAEAKNGAKIKDISVYCGSYGRVGENVTFTAANSASVYVVVTDSRGYSTTVYDKTLSLVSYVTPTIIPTISRDTPTGDTVSVYVRGIWFNGSFGAVTNTLRARVRYKVADAESYGSYNDLEIAKDGNAYSATIQLTGIAYTNAYRFEIRLDDEVYTDDKGYRTSKYASDIPLSKGIPVFDWGENDFRFNVPVTFAEGFTNEAPDDGGVVDFIVEQGTSNMFTYRKWNSGIAEAWREHRATLSVDTAYGNGFYCGTVIDLPFPSGLFIERPVVVGNVSNTSNAQLYFLVISVTRATELNYSIMSTKSNSSATMDVSLRATGRWK